MSGKCGCRWHAAPMPESPAPTRGRRSALGACAGAARAPWPLAAWDDVRRVQRSTAARWDAAVPRPSRSPYVTPAPPPPRTPCPAPRTAGRTWPRCPTPSWRSATGPSPSPSRPPRAGLEADVLRALRREEDGLVALYEANSGRLVEAVEGALAAPPRGTTASRPASRRTSGASRRGQRSSVPPSSKASAGAPRGRRRRAVNRRFAALLVREMGAAGRRGPNAPAVATGRRRGERARAGGRPGRPG